jgi:hypothetical protein
MWRKSVLAILVGAALMLFGSFCAGLIPTWVILDVFEFDERGGGRVSSETARVVAYGLWGLTTIAAGVVAGLVAARLAPARRFWHGMAGVMIAIAAVAAYMTFVGF